METKAVDAGGEELLMRRDALSVERDDHDWILEVPPSGPGTWTCTKCGETDPFSFLPLIRVVVAPRPAKLVVGHVWTPVSRQAGSDTRWTCVRCGLGVTAAVFESVIPPCTAPPETPPHAETRVVNGPVYVDGRVIYGGLPSYEVDNAIGPSLSEALEPVVGKRVRVTVEVLDDHAE